MNAEILWLRIVAGDERYAQCLTIEACERWLRSAQRKGMAAANYVVGSDGDLFAWYSNAVKGWTTWDAQLVMDEHGQVLPCTDNIAQYLRRAAAKRSQENTP